MKDRLLQLAAMFLLAIRRAATNPEVVGAVCHDYGQASPLGCVGVQALVAAWTADPKDWDEDSFLDLAHDVEGVGKFRLFDPGTNEQLSSGYLVLSLNRRWLLKQRGSNGTLGRLADAIRARLDTGVVAGDRRLDVIRR